MFGEILSTNVQYDPYDAADKQLKTLRFSTGFFKDYNTGKPKELINKPEIKSDKGN